MQSQNIDETALGASAGIDLGTRASLGASADNDLGTRALFDLDACAHIDLGTRPLLPRMRSRAAFEGGHGAPRVDQDLNGLEYGRRGPASETGFVPLRINE